MKVPFTEVFRIHSDGTIELKVKVQVEGGIPIAPGTRIAPAAVRTKTFSLDQFVNGTLNVEQPPMCRQTRRHTGSPIFSSGQTYKNPSQIWRVRNGKRS